MTTKNVMQLIFWVILVFALGAIGTCTIQSKHKALDDNKRIDTVTVIINR